jgi:acyl dehydratase
MADAGVPGEVTHLLSQEAIDAYAGLSGDFNPLHVDPGYTAQTSFGGTIAHGPLSLQPMFEALCSWLGRDDLPPGCRVDASFRRAVPSGSTVTAEFSREEMGDVTIVHATCRTETGTIAIEATIEGV